MSDTNSAEGVAGSDGATGWRYTRGLGVGVGWRASEGEVLSNG